MPACAAKAPELGARAVVLMEADTGTVLYERRAYLRRPPASTTKILTALLALESAPLDTVVRVSRRAAATPGSSAHLAAGECYRLGELLKGLLLRSGNDAAVAIAEALAGGEDRFALRMNEEANRLGALASHFANPHGLHHEDHFVSAYDLGLLARRALEDGRFVSLTKAREAEMAPEGKPARALQNTNQLLEWYPGAIGVKTGTTSQAGKCLVAAARRDGLVLVAVVLKSPDRFREAARLLDWGFAHFRLVRALRAGQAVHAADGRCLGYAASDLAAVVPREATAAVSLRGHSAWLLVGGHPVARVSIASRHVPRGLPLWWHAWLQRAARHGLLQS